MLLIMITDYDYDKAVNKVLSQSSSVTGHVLSIRHVDSSSMKVCK